MSALSDRIYKLRRYLIERNIDPAVIPPLAFNHNEMLELVNEMKPWGPVEITDLRNGSEAIVHGMKGIIV